MYFDSFAALLHMDGHGVYVWLAYGVTFSVLLLLCLIPAQKKRRFLQRQLAAAKRVEV